MATVLGGRRQVRDEDASVETIILARCREERPDGSIMTPEGNITNGLLGRNASLSHEYFSALVLTVSVTAASLALEPIIGHLAISSLFLMLVVVAGLSFSRATVLAVAAISTLAWHYVFIPPRFAFRFGTLEEALVFTTFFGVAVAMGHLTSRLRMKEMAERRRERRTAALYKLVRNAGLAADLDGGLTAAINLTQTLFNVRAALLLRDNHQKLATTVHPASTFHIDGKEFTAAERAYSEGLPAGRFTEIIPDATAMYLPLQTRTATMGVLAVRPAYEASFDVAERELLATFATLIGTILERDHLSQGLIHAEIVEASERLQRALLQSVSHELKTPLAAVQAGIDALSREVLGGERSRAAVHESQQALRRLRRVINNLLDMTRIESGVVHPKLDWSDVGELIQAAVDLATDGVGEREVKIEAEKCLPMVRIDQPLLEQCLCNLLLNAASNSPAGSQIAVKARLDDSNLIVTVEDEGKGIGESELPHVFETFFRGAAAMPGGTGLGLAIVDGFIRAHGGDVTATPRQPRGMEFIMTIPVETLMPEAMEVFG